MSETIRGLASKGIVWSGIERFSIQGVHFLVQVILARLLTPDDYGLVGLLVVFINLAQTLVDSGFANALIQKQNCTDRDYSTVFIYNCAISIIVYFILFVSAPYIADFYKEEELTSVLRFLSIIVVLNSLSIIQRTRLIKKVDFQTQAKITLSSALLSGIIGIVLAYNGLGAWSLCWQQVSNSIIQFILFLLLLRWLPSLVFDLQSFKSLFKFGYKLVFASIINAIYKNLYTIVIGKKYTSESVGYYSRAEQFVVFPSANLGALIVRVIYPILSIVQNDNEKLKSIYRDSIKLSSYIIFPLMIGLLSLSEPLVLFLLTDKWIIMVPIMQILCLDWMLDHISMLNLNLLMVKGRTDLSLKLEIIKKVIAIVILFVTLPFGLIVMCWGRVLYSVLATYLNTIYTNKLISLSFLQQMRDIIPSMIASFAMGGIVYLSKAIFVSPFWQLIIGFIVGFLFYYVVSLLFFKDIIKKVMSLVKKS